MMKLPLPTPILSHHVARSVVLTPAGLKENLVRDESVGFAGATVVPVLFDKTESPATYLRAFTDTKSRGLVCGILPGDGPDPLDDDQFGAAISYLMEQAQFAQLLFGAGVGPNVMIGPVHTHHRHARLSWSSWRFERWMEQLYNLHQSTGLKLLIEVLNYVEDGTPSPFETIRRFINLHPKVFGFHWDTGHAHSRLGMTAVPKFREWAGDIGHLEFANVGREPLDQKLGIDFQGYFEAMYNLNCTCTVGVEPFAQEVIEAFGLRLQCTTLMSGEDTLVRDSCFLTDHGIRASKK